MPSDILTRRLLMAGVFAIMLTGPALAQHSDEGETDHGTSEDHGSGGGHTGAQRGRPEDPHSGEDDHDDDHGDDHGDDHDSGHESGGKGRGPLYKGGRETYYVGFGRGRSLEDRVLTKPDF